MTPAWRRCAARPPASRNARGPHLALALAVLPDRALERAHPGRTVAAVALGSRSTSPAGLTAARLKLDERVLHFVLVSTTSTTRPPRCSEAVPPASLMADAHFRHRRNAPPTRGTGRPPADRDALWRRIDGSVMSPPRWRRRSAWRCSRCALPTSQAAAHEQASLIGSWQR